MKRGKFIRKWLANPQKQYNEQCRDEMRDDLDLVIQAAIGKSEQKQLLIKIMNEDAKDGLYKQQTAVEWLFHQLWEEPKDKFTWYAILEVAKEMEKQQRQIELPSDEEIKEYVKSTGYYGHCTCEYHEGIEEGAKWMRDKIGGNNEQQ